MGVQGQSCVCQRYASHHCEAHLDGRHVAEPRSMEFEQFLLLEAVLAEMGYHAFRTEVRSQ